MGGKGSKMRLGSDEQSRQDTCASEKHINVLPSSAAPCAPNPRTYPQPGRTFKLAVEVVPPEGDGVAQAPLLPPQKGRHREDPLAQPRL